VRALTKSQRTDILLLSRGFVSSAMAARMGTLVRRGLVEALGLYDRENKTKRYGSDRYRISDLGRAELR
jgi:hypothetical protein